MSWKTRHTEDLEATMAVIRRLDKPKGRIDAVFDTDTYNEIDDQFALAYLIRSDEKITIKGIYAAPFYNSRSTSPQDGMERSYDEILNVLTLMERDDLKGLVHKGSKEYLPDEKTPVTSPAAAHLVELAKSYTPERPLYVIAIGAITNIASAILLDPTITDKIVVVWLGGHAYHWPNNNEFNLMQDIAGARVLFGSGAAIVQLPCMGVVSSFAVSGPELVHWLKGKNKLCDYLVEYSTEQALVDGGMKNWTRVIWDVTAVAWVLDGGFMEDRLEPAPIPEYDHRYAHDKNNYFIRYVYHIHRDKLFLDLFEKLSR